MSTAQETVGYESVGRTQQKSRTRAALLASARALIAGGRTPTVEDAAAEASISRTTAYRYFPNQHALLVAAHPETEAASLLADDAGDDPEVRLDLVVDAFTRLIADTEQQQRTMLRLSLTPDADRRAPGLLRRGRAIGWISEALTPLRGHLPDADLDRLVLAVRSAIGIEARVWLTDVAGLSPDAATELMCWSAKALYRATVRET